MKTWRKLLGNERGVALPLAMILLVVLTMLALTFISLGSVDISGTNTSMAAIAAEAFGVPMDKVRVVNGDSESAPYSGAAGGSSWLAADGGGVGTLGGG